MSRLKIMLLVAIVAIAVIIFGQNRDPIILKLLCPDDQQSCLYQTPPLPLALWLGLFTIIGILTNLLVQALHRQGYGDKTTLDQRIYPNKQPRTTPKNRSNYTNPRADIQDKISSTKSFEVPQKPQNVERSGTNYSYIYREAEDSSVMKQDKNSSTSAKDQAELTSNIQEDDEDWI